MLSLFSSRSHGANSAAVNMKKPSWDETTSAWGLFGLINILNPSPVVGKPDSLIPWILDSLLSLAALFPPLSSSLLFTAALALLRVLQPCRAPLDVSRRVTRCQGRWMVRRAAPLSGQGARFLVRMQGCVGSRRGERLGELVHPLGRVGSVEETMRCQYPEAQTCNGALNSTTYGLVLLRFR